MKRLILVAVVILAMIVFIVTCGTLTEALALAHGQSVRNSRSYRILFTSVLLAILGLPFVVSAGLQFAIRRPILASLCGAIILPAMLLIRVAVKPPGPRTLWQITLALAVVWGSITGPIGAILSRELVGTEAKAKTK